MQIIVGFIFLAVWLLVLWIGSLALEATGMERGKARFQALSALTGTGFTTREAESVVNHPRRRRIVTWLIVLGSIGIMTFLVLLILYVRAGLVMPPRLHIVIFIVVVLAFILVVWVGIIRHLSNVFVRLLRPHRADTTLKEDEVLYQTGEYVVTRLVVKSDVNTLKETGLAERSVSVLAVEKGDWVIPNPGDETPLAAGDGLLCFGEAAETNAFK